MQKDEKNVTQNKFKIKFLPNILECSLQIPTCPLFHNNIYSHRMPHCMEKDVEICNKFYTKIIFCWSGMFSSVWKTNIGAKPNRCVSVWRFLLSLNPKRISTTKHANFIWLHAFLFFPYPTFFHGLKKDWKRKCWSHEQKQLISLVF